jgi:hypothetical protein
MSTIETHASRLSPELQEDTDALMAHLTTGRPLEPRIASRIRERGEQIREMLFKEHGLLDLGTPAIRESREE